MIYRFVLTLLERKNSCLQNKFVLIQYKLGNIAAVSSSRTPLSCFCQMVSAEGLRFCNILLIACFN